MAWEEVCLPKGEGGLGLTDINRWNQAFLAKQLWDIIRGKKSLWIDWKRSTYLSTCDIWSWNPGEKESALIRAIKKTRDALVDSLGGQRKCMESLSSPRSIW